VVLDAMNLCCSVRDLHVRIDEGQKALSYTCVQYRVRTHIVWPAGVTEVWYCFNSGQASQWKAVGNGIWDSLSWILENSSIWTTAFSNSVKCPI
jgi:hypothetical protein